MNIKQETIGDLNDVITIEFVPVDYQSQVEKALRELKQKANMSGFRKGMIPISLIKKMYGESVVIEEMSKLANNKLTEYLKEKDIDILFSPILYGEKTFVNFDQLDKYSISMEVGLRPEIDLDYHAAKQICYYKIIPTEQEIDAEIKEMRKNIGKKSLVETVSDDPDDMVGVTVTLPDGESFSTSMFIFQIKEDEQYLFIGKQLQDEMDIDTAKIFINKDGRASFLHVKGEYLETAPTLVHIRITAIHHIIPAELDAVFFEETFPDGTVSNETELREYIEDNTEQKFASDLDYSYYQDVIRFFLGNTSFALPDEFIKRYLLEKEEKYTPDYIEEYYEGFKNMFSEALIKAQIAKDYNIEITIEEIKAHVENLVHRSYSVQYPLTNKQKEQLNKQIEAIMEDEETIQKMHDRLMEIALILTLKKNLKPEIKKVTIPEYVEILRVEQNQDQNQEIEKEEINSEL
jgi:trigger factor